jgi:hypothetical protein
MPAHKDAAMAKCSRGIVNLMSSGAGEEGEGLVARSCGAAWSCDLAPNGKGSLT